MSLKPLTKLLLAVVLFIPMATGYAQAAVDGWTLALTWHPGYCRQHSAATECRADQRPPRLVLHGLWPESTSGQGQAEFCAVNPLSRKIDGAGAWCRLPEPELSAGTSAALDAAMPGRAACLERHEWLRHGSCATMSAERYFSTAAALSVRINALAIGKFLQERAGGPVSATELYRAAGRDVGQEGNRAFAFICAGGGESPHLAEVWISLTMTGPWTFPAPTAFRAASLPARHCPHAGDIIVDGP